MRSSAVEATGLEKPLWGRATVIVPASHLAALGDVVVLNLRLEEFAEQLQSAKPEPPGSQASGEPGDAEAPETV